MNNFLYFNTFKAENSGSFRKKQSEYKTADKLSALLSVCINNRNAYSIRSQHCAFFFLAETVRVSLYKQYICSAYISYYQNIYYINIISWKIIKYTCCFYSRYIYCQPAKNIIWTSKLFIESKQANILKKIYSCLNSWFLYNV